MQKTPILQYLLCYLSFSLFFYFFFFSAEIKFKKAFDSGVVVIEIFSVY